MNQTDDMISAMVKGRESCRRLVQLYESARRRGGTAADAPDQDLRMLKSAENTATQMLSHLSRLPENPCQAMSSDEARSYGSKLLQDIKEMLEKAIMLEREMRLSAPHRCRDQGEQSRYA